MAAGQAKRMGRDKLALPWRQSTVLEYILSTVLNAMDHVRELAAVQRGGAGEPGKWVQAGKPIPAAGPVELWVVAREALSHYASIGLRERFTTSQGVWCCDPAPRPLAETIRLGLQDLPEAVKGIAFLPADQVGVKTDTLVQLLDCFLKTEPDFLVPVAEEPGSPAFFHRRYLPELMLLSGEAGGKKVLSEHKAAWTVYPVDLNFFDDIDTLEQYRRLRE